MLSHRAAAILPSILLAAAFATTAHAEEQNQPVVVVSPGATVTVTGGAIVAPAPAPVAVAAAAPATTGGAPQNADWSDLSHINGQLVKVGETNDYHKTFKRTNVSTNPIGWIYGSYGLSVSYGLNDHIALRGDINYLSGYLDDDTTGMEIGVGVPFYFRRTYQGVFLEPGFISRRTTSNDCWECDGSDSDTSTSTTVGPQMLVGWHWTWNSGLNVAIAGGVGRNWSTDHSYDKIFPNGYLRFGYAF